MGSGTLSTLSHTLRMVEARQALPTRPLSNRMSYVPFPRSTTTVQHRGRGDTATPEEATTMQCTADTHHAFDKPERCMEEICQTSVAAAGNDAFVTGPSAWTHPARMTAHATGDRTACADATP